VKLRASQTEVLKLVPECDPLGISPYRLAGLLGISRGAARARLRRLEALGLLTEPGWMNYYRLTPKGRETARDLMVEEADRG
jgi:Mn-dependent DtxR family transcriptional regulator